MDEKAKRNLISGASIAIIDQLRVEAGLKEGDILQPGFFANRRDIDLRGQNLRVKIVGVSRMPAVVRLQDDAEEGRDAGGEFSEIIDPSFGSISPGGLGYLFFNSAVQSSGILKEGASSLSMEAESSEYSEAGNTFVPFQQRPGALSSIIDGGVRLYRCRYRLGLPYGVEMEIAAGAGQVYGAWAFASPFPWSDITPTRDASLSPLDTRLGFKKHLPHGPPLLQNFGKTMCLELGLPTGTGFFSTGNFSLFPRLILDYRLPGTRVDLVLNAGTRFMSSMDTFNGLRQEVRLKPSSELGFAASFRMWEPVRVSSALHFSENPLRGVSEMQPYSKVLISASTRLTLHLKKKEFYIEGGFPMSESAANARLSSGLSFRF
ncbi:MAG: hypothetical protein HQL31_13105 [Planctomycetes bacterium]|nr:hypothetical protein [Planctomycetota bacterium]